MKKLRCWLLGHDWIKRTAFLPGMSPLSYRLCDHCLAVEVINHEKEIVKHAA